MIILANRLTSSLFSCELKHIRKKKRKKERIQKVAKKKTEIISTNSTQFTKNLTDKNVAILVDEVHFSRVRTMHGHTTKQKEERNKIITTREV